MPRAGPSRSQRQPSQTQTQRYSRSQRRVEDDDEEEVIETQNFEDDDEPNLDDAGTVRVLPSFHPPCFKQHKNALQDLKKRAINLVRLALFHEQRRQTLRRDEISKKVMGSQRGVAFKAVFEEAQSILRRTFGMELVELPTRAATQQEKDHQERRAVGATQNGDDGGDRQAVTGLKKKGTVSCPRFSSFLV
jgi:melanoma-associated antigen